jgi:hypothetical protein
LGLEAKGAAMEKEKRKQQEKQQQRYRKPAVADTF